ncbi:bifunctional enoyl-CoA hydratase/phosphate acetyltransferase [Rhizobiales bacterium]|uniref:bifunctional enoyl-CoA hydratase/phosphate acetyltransferase n=1 Tax=Hongsoonwoonella zoysiae TaxID=2821844 RepID=UPI001560A454|nr:bifunctional enoyl-CoA hydratase/phosphate acetyltransferase [Hongsoonwoonella zoysiae]NRG16141.1 bifunctional enoyl-CoA hydratase/phosphate acetyltransferase [Hongsoonwoonella zoysiae]
MARNKTYDEISVGDCATLTRTLNANDLFVFAHASGNVNPMHLPGVDWTGDGKVDEPIAPSMWAGALISAVLGNVLPGPGTVYRSQTLNFRDRAHLGDRLEVSARVTAKKSDGIVELKTQVKREDGDVIAEGDAIVTAPERTITFDASSLPGILIERHQHFDRLLEAAETLAPLPTAVVAPDDPNSLGGTALAAREGLIDPVLVGARSRIEVAASEIGLDLSPFELIDVDPEDAAAARAVALVHEGRVRAVMKGHLHTEDLLRHIVKRDGGLRMKRRLSHCFVMDIPGRASPVIISDAAINISPDLQAKVDIVQNAIDIARSLGIATPKVGILSAIETVNPAIPSTLDAAVLSKMAERGQIKGGIVDGPLAMDNAIDIQAAKSKGITSLVAGHADVLVVPNLEAGNMLAKELTFIAHAEAAGLVAGAKVPVMLTSRADNDRARLCSCVLALLYDHWQKTGEALVRQSQESGA